MVSAVFSSSTEAYQIENIIYAGPVTEIPEEKRRFESTHSFSIMTSLGKVRFYYRSFDSAVKARKALGAMMMNLKPHLFRHGYQLIDPKRIVSFRKVIQLKTPQEEFTHAVVVSMDTLDPQNQEVWLRYKSEENAQKGRRALFAASCALNESPQPVNAKEAPRAEPGDEKELVSATVNEDGLPF